MAEEWRIINWNGTAVWLLSVTNVPIGLALDRVTGFLEVAQNPQVTINGFARLLIALNPSEPDRPRRWF
jgi:hypothetical protein